MIASPMSALMLAAALPSGHGQMRLEFYPGSMANPAGLMSPFGAPPSLILWPRDLESRSAHQKLLTPSSADADPIAIILADPGPPADPASQVAELRRLSGLTWAQLSELFGVSNRTPFNWAAGEQLHPDHQRQLGERLSAIRYVDRGAASENRALLFSPAPDGRTYFELLKSGELELFKASAGAGIGRPQFSARLTPEAAAFNAPVHFGENFEPGRISVEEDLVSPRDPKLRRVAVTRRTSSAGSS